MARAWFCGRRRLLPIARGHGSRPARAHGPRTASDRLLHVHELWRAGDACRRRPGAPHERQAQRYISIGLLCSRGALGAGGRLDRKTSIRSWHLRRGGLQRPRRADSNVGLRHPRRQHWFRFATGTQPCSDKASRHLPRDLGGFFDLVPGTSLPACRPRCSTILRIP